MPKVNVYLNFARNTEEAFNFKRAPEDYIQKRAE